MIQLEAYSTQIYFYFKALLFVFVPVRFHLWFWSWWKILIIFEQDNDRCVSHYNEYHIFVQKRDNGSHHQIWCKKNYTSVHLSVRYEACFIFMNQLPNYIFFQEIQMNLWNSVISLTCVAQSQTYFVEGCIFTTFLFASASPNIIHLYH